MRFTRFHLRFVLLGLFVLMLLWAGLRLWMGISFGPWMDQLVPNALLFGIVAVFLANRWMLRQEEKAQDSEEGDNIEPPESKESPKN